MNQATIARLDALFAESPILLAGGPVSDDEINRAEADLGVAFDADYRWFVQRYGGAMVGSLPVYGLRTSEVMGENETIINETRRFRGEDVVARDWLVISGDGFGNPIAMTKDGRVRLPDHDSGEMLDVAASFEAFLLNLLDGRLYS